MKRFMSMILALVLGMALSGCGKVPTWQEQYDLGIRYLSEGNYQEAIIAFTAAIEIDPKQAPAYVGRGDAYIGSGETEGNLTAAKADYEMAIELDETCVEAYIGLADVYVCQENYNKALEILEKGYIVSEDEQLQRKRTELNEILINNSEYGQTEFTKREMYYKYEVLPSDVQRYIETMIDALVANDTYTLRRITDVTNPDSLPKNFYTFWNGYKIQSLGLPNREQELKTIPGGNSSDFGIEIRPQNGMGYYCEVSTLGMQYIDNHIDYDNSVVILSSCNCTNWQYNGTMQYDFFTCYDDNWGDVSSRSYTGTIINGLFEGDFTCLNMWIMTTTDGPSYHETIDSYERGKLIKKNSFDIHHEIGYLNFHGIPYYDSTPNGKLEVVNQLYW